MTVAVVSITPEASAAQAAWRMHAAKVKRLPVVDDRGRLVGIISRSDLLKVFNRPDEAIRREIIEEVIVGEFMMTPTASSSRSTRAWPSWRARSSGAACSRCWSAPSAASRGWSRSRTGWPGTWTTATPPPR
jgi:hypothetical protein